MALENEKEEIARLRYKDGLTLQQIANKFGKSIYWVNSRLDTKYLPKSIRRIATDDTETPITDGVDDPLLASEIEQISLLRNHGLTYEQIANQLNRSVYWVHTRLRQKYRPKGARAEKEFQEKRVVPFLVRLGHTDIRQYIRVSGNGISQEADIISRMDGHLVITEVKIHLTHHQLQTAIGQLLLHRVALSEDDIPQIQIALPFEADRKKVSNVFLASLEKLENIRIVFVP
jgi:transcriptional regulator with XRE-family HTH domain